jgi:hypothetical protein
VGALLARGAALGTYQFRTPETVKSAKGGQKVDKTGGNDHLKISIAALKQLINNGVTMMHLRF